MIYIMRKGIWGLVLLGILSATANGQSTIRMAQERIEDTLETNFWEKTGFGVSYLGAICSTGRELEPTSDEFLFLPLYLLNLVEGEAYHINNNWKVGISTGYGYAALKSQGINWAFKLIPASIEVELPKDFFYFIVRARLGYVHGFSDAVGIDCKDLRGDGNGFIYSVGYLLNNYLSVEIIGGSIRFSASGGTGKSNVYPVTLPFYGISGSIRLTSKK